MNNMHGINYLFPQSLRKMTPLSFIVVIAILFLCVSDAYAAKPKRNFDHATSGFVLTSPHVRLECNTCHLRGIFKGIPRQCVNCHDRGSQIGTTQKPLNHVQTSGDCESCHAGSTWAVTRFDHSGVMGTCKKCHNNVTATGKSANHVQTNGSCDDCHITAAWLPARFDHSGVTGSCFSCHNGVIATPKSPNHVTSSNSCDNCHSTNAWTPARFDHSDVAGTCSSCHDGSRAPGKTQNHIQVSCQCDACHTTNNWDVPRGRVDHGCVTGTCVSCHNNSIVPGKPQSHVSPSSDVCDDCHLTTSWIPANYDHDSAGVVSTDSCIGCHATKYKSGPHLKTEKLSEVNQIKVYYSMSELQNCASSECHIYKDGNYIPSNISEPRSGGSEHSIDKW